MTIPSARDPLLSGKMMSPLHREMVIRDTNLRCSSFPDIVLNTTLPSLCIALQQWSTVHFEQSPFPASLYQAIFVPWALLMHPSTIISKYYVYACLFSLIRMIDCSVLFICKAPSSTIGLRGYQLFSVRKCEMIIKLRDYSHPQQLGSGILIDH